MNELVDYAMPLMQIDTQSRIVHDFCLDKQYMKALDHVLQMELALATLRRNLILMQLKEKT